MKQVSSCRKHTHYVYSKSIRQTDIYTRGGISDFCGLDYRVPMKNLARIRKSKKITQLQLAEAVGIKQATVSRIEAGVNDTSLATIENMADYLGVTPAELFGLPEMEQMVIEKFREASPQRRAALLALLQSD